MEDVLEVYQRPYDPLRPVVCMDEMNRQLVEETRIPCKARQLEKVDSEYVRKGVMDVFMIAEPLAGKRDTVVTYRRTAVDFAHVLLHTSDVLYPQAEKIVLVTDNLNTHTAHCTKRFLQNRRKDSHSALNGTIPQNMEAG